MSATLTNASLSSAALLPRTRGLTFERFGFAFQQLTEVRWRISNAKGAIVGYLERREDAAASDRWAITRMTADRRQFVTLGSFASQDEAIDALKWM